MITIVMVLTIVWDVRIYSWSDTTIRFRTPGAGDK